MKFWFFISLLFNLLLSINSTVTQTEDHPPFLHSCFSNRGNYTANSIYHVRQPQSDSLSDLPSTDNGYGFYNTSAGQNPDKAHAIGLCRGDLKPDPCRSCLDGVRNLLIEACPSEKEAIGWYENCMLRFSNRSLHGSTEVVPAFSLWKAESLLSGDDVAAGFNRKLKNLLKTLRTEAAGGGNLRKFAAGSASVRVARNSNQLTIYALVQCTPDLSETDCKRCLLEAFWYIPRCCDGKDTGRLVIPSCNLRFELSLFFDKAATVLPLPVSHSSPPPISANTTRISQGILKNQKLWNVMILVMAIVGGVLSLFMCYCLRVLGVDRISSEQITTASSSVVESPKTTSSVYVTQISYDDVILATGGFADKRGQGGFGPVFKGLLNGQDIAVKILSTEYEQGDVHFSTEVAVLGNLRHGNLVKLLHFSVEGDERVLVYESKRGRRFGLG
ncbi:cysteine-rich repeat secretory protein 38-like isoform X2 [Rosa rugosa]|uniref:cysteine-rich repeat secretory protein 38-like isoform X2 n=1 Tax=Rosa rugosa TaxID=74645 RepID=UPI002B401F5E|nr:cysteine-rich repeat secretory protein 38-like isoform X2 [Rosa rugosa]